MSDDAVQWQAWRAVFRGYDGTTVEHAVGVEPWGDAWRAWLGDTNYWGDGATPADAVTAMAVAYGDDEDYTLAEVVAPGAETHAETVARAVAEEREECAVVADERRVPGDDLPARMADTVARDIARDIRARGGR